jgi:hypothetical protein
MSRLARLELQLQDVVCHIITTLVYNSVKP